MPRSSGLVRVAVAFCYCCLLAASSLADPERSPSETSLAAENSAHVGTTADAPATATPADQAIRFRETQTDEQTALAVSNASVVSAVPKRFQYALRFNFRGVYDDNIYLRQTGRVSDVYFAFEPGITLGFGDIVGREQNSIRIDYAPSFFLYADHSNANSMQQLIRLDGQYRMGHLSLSLTQDVQILEGTTNPNGLNFGANTGLTPTLNIDTGGNTGVNIFTTNANFSYDLTGKTFLSGGLQFSAYDYEQLISSEQIQGNLFINYIYSPKLTAGLGGTFGYNAVDGPTADQTFEQVNLRLTYQLSGKVSLDGSAGVEFRQSSDPGSTGSYISPVFQLGATYQPFDGTTINLRGSSRTQNSAVLAGQDYTTTNIDLSVRQRFLRRIYFGVAAGYQRADYVSSTTFNATNRSDDYFYFEPSLDVTLTRFWTAGAYYLYRRDDSSLGGFSFYDNQLGMRTSLTF